MRFNHGRYCLLGGALLFAMAPLLFGGCIFTPRDAQDPGDDTGSSWIVPDNPTKVL